MVDSHNIRIVAKIKDVLAEQSFSRLSQNSKLSGNFFKTNKIRFAQVEQIAVSVASGTKFRSIVEQSFSL